MTVYFDGTLTNSIVPPFDHVNDDNPGNFPATIVTSPTRYAGGHALQLTRNGSNSGVTFRVEVGTSVFSTPHSNSAPDEAYYGCSIRFPGSNSGQWMINSWDWQNCWQWIARLSNGSFIALGYFYINTGDFGVTSPHLNFDWNLNADGGSVGTRTGTHQDLGAIVYDSWYDIVTHVIWSTSTTGGLFECWIGGSLKFSVTMRTYPSSGTIYTELQNYRGDNNGTTTHYYDMFKIGSTYADVDPAAAGGGSSSVYFSDDFESGNLLKWNFVQDGVSDATNGNTVLSVSTAQARKGTHSASFAVNDNTGNAATVQQANLVLQPATGRGSNGLESWYGFSTFLPSSMIGRWPAAVTDANDLTDWSEGGPTFTGKNILLGVDTGDYDTSNPHYFVNLNVKQDGTGFLNRTGGRWTDTVAVSYDAWTDWVFHIMWASTATGILEVWKGNGASYTRVLSLLNVLTLYPTNAANGVQYAPRLRLASGTTIRQLYIDQVTIGNAFAVADPSGGTATGTTFHRRRGVLVGGSRRGREAGG